MNKQDGELIYTRIYVKEVYGEQIMIDVQANYRRTKTSNVTSYSDLYLPKVVLTKRRAIKKLVELSGVRERHSWCGLQIVFQGDTGQAALDWLDTYRVCKKLAERV